MERDFRKAVETYRDNTRSNPDGGVADHVVIFPRPRRHVSWQRRIDGNRDRPGQADLAAVGVPTQQQTEVGMSSLTIDLWGVRQQD